MSVSNVTAAGKRVIRQGIRTTMITRRDERGGQHQHEQHQHEQNAVLQASLAARVQQINYTIRWVSVGVLVLKRQRESCFSGHQFGQKHDNSSSGTNR